MATSTIKKEIYNDSKQGTTGSNGELSIGLSASNYEMLSAKCTSSGNVVAIPYRVGSGTWNVVCFNLVGWTKVASTSVTIKYTYTNS